MDPANPKLALIDLQYTDIDPAKSLYHALVRKGRMRTLVSDEDLAAAYRGEQLAPERTSLRR